MIWIWALFLFSKFEFTVEKIQSTNNFFSNLTVCHEKNCRCSNSLPSSFAQRSIDRSSFTCLKLCFDCYLSLSTQFSRRPLRISIRWIKFVLTFIRVFWWFNDKSSTLIKPSWEKEKLNSIDRFNFEWCVVRISSIFRCAHPTDESSIINWRRGFLQELYPWMDWIRSVFTKNLELTLLIFDFYRKVIDRKTNTTC